MTQKLMSINIKSLCFVGLAILLAVSTQQLAQAQQSKDYLEGHKDVSGRRAADEGEGYPKVASCQGERTADYCAGFILGYNEGYGCSQKVDPDLEPNPSNSRSEIRSHFIRFDLRSPNSRSNRSSVSLLRYSLVN